MCLLIVDWILDILTFALLDVEYICICVDIFELCSGMLKNSNLNNHLSYLETVDPSLLDLQYLEPFFFSFILSSFSVVLGGGLNPVSVSLSSPKVEVEDEQLDRIAHASITTDFHLPEKGSKKPEIYYYLLWGLILKGWPPKYHIILGKFLQICILSNATL